MLIEGDVRLIDWLHLAQVQFKRHRALFNVIYMDPPWKCNLDLNYPVMNDSSIFSIPFGLLQSEGYLFVWILNMKEQKVIKMLQLSGYKMVDKIVWVKLTSRGNPVNGNGYYVRHSTETLFIFKKGATASFSKLHSAKDVISASVRGASVKPDEAYDEIRKLVPQGHYLEIFGRSHNARPDWVTVGNQLHA